MPQPPRRGPTGETRSRFVRGPGNTMLVAPVAGRGLLSPRAARERLWQAYAVALNTDNELISPAGYGLFLDELRALHETVCGGVMFQRQDAAVRAAIAFAARWRLRRRDVWDGCKLMEMHDRPGAPADGQIVFHMALVEPDAVSPISPVAVAPAQPALLYDISHISGEDVRGQIHERYRDAMDATERAEREWIRLGLLIEIPAHHADPGTLVALARRWTRVVKGWSVSAVAFEEGVSRSSLRSSLEPWRKLDAGRLTDDGGFSPER